MAYPSLAILVLACLFSASICTQQSEEESSKLQLSVYYETMCPYCRRHILEDLHPTYTQLSDILDVQLVPYGNAKSSSRPDGTGYTFSCQHGPTECLGNMVHACAIKYVKFPILMDFIACMMERSDVPVLAGKECASKLEIEWTEIEECSMSLEGEQLLFNNGEETNNLTPPKTVVPTDTLNGSQDDQEELIHNLKQKICSSYPGPKPAAC
ncbi:gamma-interferon-inducible lysosomal thiol reductase [Lepeophtheirus salmonis]|nr:gamma-interferon-inducible lysosomal thiol reductase-like [Lepeophtheirus salmonis]